MRGAGVWDGATHRVLETKARLQSMLRAEGQTPQRSGANTGDPEAKEKWKTVKLPEVRVQRWGHSGVRAGGGQGKKGSESMSGGARQMPVRERCERHPLRWGTFLS